MRLESLAKRLEAAGVGKLRTDIHIHYMPDNVAQGVALLNDLSGVMIDHEIPGYFKGEVQLLVRAKTFEAGMELVERAVEALTITVEEIVVGLNGAPTMKFNYLRPIHLPIPFPRSDNGPLEFSVNFEACYAIII